MSALPQNAAFPRAGVTVLPEQEAADWPTAISLLRTAVGLLKDLVRAAEVSAVEASDRTRYTTEEVARKLGKRPRTTQKWCRDRQVNCIRIIRDGTYRVTREEVERVRDHGLRPAGAGT